MGAIEVPVGKYPSLDFQLLYSTFKTIDYFLIMVTGVNRKTLSFILYHDYFLKTFSKEILQI